MQQRPVLHLDAGELFGILHLQDGVGRHPHDKRHCRFILEQPIVRRPPLQQHRHILDVLRERRAEVERQFLLQLRLEGLPLRKRQLLTA